LNHPPQNPEQTIPCQKIPPTSFALNINSIAKPKALEQLEIKNVGYNIEIAIISEACLKSIHLDSIIRIPGYTIFRKARTNRAKSGVATIAKNYQLCQLKKGEKDFRT